jgi:hypothetical protein
MNGFFGNSSNSWPGIRGPHFQRISRQSNDTAVFLPSAAAPLREDDR